MPPDLRSGGWRTRFFARGYDAYMNRESVESSWLGRIRAELVEPLTGSVLEVGAGAGHNLRYLTGADGITLVEPIPAMRALLDERTRGVPQVTAPIEVLTGLAEELPVPDASQDAVLSMLVLCSLADPERAVGEMVRVLRPGGRIVFLEHVAAAGLLGVAQRLVRPFSQRFGGNCDPSRDTESTLRAAARAADARFEMRTLIGCALGPVERPVIAGRIEL